MSTNRGSPPSGKLLAHAQIILHIFMVRGYGLREDTSSLEKFAALNRVFRCRVESTKRWSKYTTPEHTVQRSQIFRALAQLHCKEPRCAEQAVAFSTQRT